MDNPKQRMIKKPSLLALGKNHMLFATEQQNFLSSGVLLRLIMQGACVTPHAPADGGATWVEGAPQKHVEWREVTERAGPGALMGKPSSGVSPSSERSTQHLCLANCSS